MGSLSGSAENLGRAGTCLSCGCRLVLARASCGTERPLQATTAFDRVTAVRQRTPADKKASTLLRRPQPPIPTALDEGVLIVHGRMQRSVHGITAFLSPVRGGALGTRHRRRWGRFQ